MITRHLQMIEELREMGYAVAVICPEDLGVVDKEDAERWMYEVVDDCIEITMEDERNEH